MSRQNRVTAVCGKDVGFGVPIGGGGAPWKVKLQQELGKLGS